MGIHRGIEWTSVFETFVCLCVLYLSVCGQIFSFSSFNLLFLFIYLLVLYLWANFLISLFQPSLFIQYSTEEYSTVQVFIWCLDTIAYCNVLLCTEQYVRIFILLSENNAPC